MDIPLKIEEIKQENSLSFTFESSAKTPVRLYEFSLKSIYIADKSKQDEKVFCPSDAEIYSNQVRKLGACWIYPPFTPQ